MHYARDRAGQDLTARRKKLRGASLSERLEFYAAPPDDAGCRLWTGGVDKCGYPVISLGSSGKSAQAHRVAYELGSGEVLTGGEVVHHKCSVRHCVEYTHLQKVDGTNNTAEMLERTWYLKRIAELEAEVARLTYTDNDA